MIDWSSDVCSSDLRDGGACVGHVRRIVRELAGKPLLDLRRFLGGDRQGSGAKPGSRDTQCGEGRLQGLGWFLHIGSSAGLLVTSRPTPVRSGRAGVVFSSRRGIAVAGRSESGLWPPSARSEEHTSELQSLMRISYAVVCLKKKT